MKSTHSLPRRLRSAACLLLAASILLPPGVRAQNPAVDIARFPVQQVGGGGTALDLTVLGVGIGMKWGEARAMFDNGNVPYIIQKGTSPVVYIPPQNPTYYFVLNPSSYEIIEMGVMGTADLPTENQFLFDAGRWRLTTARTQFFGTEGEFIVNEEGESYNFPFQGFVLKFLSTGAFRFVMVRPTNSPLTRHGESLQDRPVRETVTTPPPPAPSAPIEVTVQVQDQHADLLQMWQDRFQQARNDFEARQYSAALEGFREIAAGCGDEMLKARATYWTGECLFGMKNYREARKVFHQVLRDTNIESLRAPAQFMASRCDKLLKR